MIPSERLASVVANGEAEIGFQQIVELLPVDGVTVVGSLPAEGQRYTVFSGGIATNANDPAGAEALTRFLSSPDAALRLRAPGSKRSRRRLRTERRLAGLCEQLLESVAVQHEGLPDFENHGKSTVIPDRPSRQRPTNASFRRSQDFAPTICWFASNSLNEDTVVLRLFACSSSNRAAEAACSIRAAFACVILSI